MRNRAFGNMTLRIRRKEIFLDSFHHFNKKRTEELKVYLFLFIIDVYEK
jgi:hypothetical protein